MAAEAGISAMPTFQVYVVRLTPLCHRRVKIRSVVMQVINIHALHAITVSKFMLFICHAKSDCEESCLRLLVHDLKLNRPDHQSIRNKLSRVNCPD